MVGAGQLARMTQGAAIELGVRLRVLAESSDASAAQVVPDAPVGDHRDAGAVTAFAGGGDGVTFDHEHVPTLLLRSLEAAGTGVHPRAGAPVPAPGQSLIRGRAGPP